MGRNIISGPAVGAWVAQRVNGGHSPEHETAIGLERDGQIIAGVIYERWNGRSIVAHIAIEGRVTAAFIAAIFDYPFNRCGVQKIICPITTDNERSIRLAKNMGFREEARIADAAPTGDLLLFTLPKNNCRFLGAPFFGKIRTDSATSP